MIKDIRVLKFKWVLLAFCLALFVQKVLSQTENVLGEYCFDQDTNNNSDQWVLLKYKGGVEPLFSYTNCSFSWKYAILPDYDYFFSGPSKIVSNLDFNENKPAKCAGNVSKKLVNISFEKIPWFLKTQKLETDSIFGHYFKINWEVSYDSSYIRHHKNGAARFLISGFCTKEQIAWIQNRNKVKSKTGVNPQNIELDSK
ncbi:MAG: hypothetical protein HUK21_09975 [Fibrobacteraceae bacterium]|nr:hypothetical protein [Fibrobacteraceae bacterium]